MVLVAGVWSEVIPSWSSIVDSRQRSASRDPQVVVGRNTTRRQTGRQLCDLCWRRWYSATLWWTMSACVPLQVYRDEQGTSFADLYLWWVPYRYGTLV